MNVLSMDTTPIPEVSSRGESRSISSKKALTGNGPVSIALHTLGDPISFR